MKTIFSVFREYAEAKETVDQLIGVGETEVQLNVLIEQAVAKNAIADLDSHRATVQKTDEVGEKKIHGLDALLVGRQPVRVPDVGEVYSAGELATMIARTASMPGETNGGLANALNEFGVPPEVAQQYVDEINQGSLLIILRAEDDRAAEVAGVLKNGGALRVDNYPR